jgi:hypothetical protein
MQMIIRKALSSSPSESHITISGSPQMQVVVRELKDEGKITLTAPRGGEKASSHVELLGNVHFMHDFLHAAAGRHDEIDQDIITSDIDRITSRFPQRIGAGLKK